MLHKVNTDAVFVIVFGPRFLRSTWPTFEGQTPKGEESAAYAIVNVRVDVSVRAGVSGSLGG